MTYLYHFEIWMKTVIPKLKPVAIYLITQVYSYAVHVGIGRLAEFRRFKKIMWKS